MKGKRMFIGICLSGSFMIFGFIVVWLWEIGGLREMYADDSYPMSLLFVPVMAIAFSAIGFWIIVAPVALIMKRQTILRGWESRKAIVVASAVCGLIGGTLGGLSGGIAGALTYTFYFGIAQWIFFWVVADQCKTDGEADHPLPPSAQ